MQHKIQQLACQTLVSRVEYCVENLQMRNCFAQFREFAAFESKIEAVEFIAQIYERKKLFESLIQWVKVVYAQELVQAPNGATDLKRK